MSGFEVDTEQLQQMSDTIDQKTKEMREGVTELRIAMNKLNQGWEGAAHEEFVQSVEQDLRSLEKLISNVKKIRDFQNRAKQEYVSCENKVADYMNEL